MYLLHTHTEVLLGHLLLEPVLHVQVWLHRSQGAERARRDLPGRDRLEPDCGHR